MEKTDELKLKLLKYDLRITTDKLDPYLTFLLGSSRLMIARAGITLAESEEDDHLQLMYAAYLYRRRSEKDQSMPRMLRYALNNRLMSEKMGGAEHG